MSKHTSGPWKAGRDDMATIEHGVDSKWVYADSKYIALASGIGTQTWEETMANAHLIAAAPEMLEALKDVLMHAARVGPEYKAKGLGEIRMVGAVRRAYAAIAKAEGKKT